MFRKVLVANRGEIAVRVVRACRDLGIETVAVFEPPDRGALHTRLATECVPLASEKGYSDQELVLSVAREKGVDAVHPGYGFFAENAAFARACEESGIRFVGPSSETIAALQDKVQALGWVERAGFAVPAHSPRAYGEEPGDAEALEAEAGRIGYPLVIKSMAGGRGRGARLVRSAARLAAAVAAAQNEAWMVYGDRRVYLEKAVPKARQLGVQLAGDDFGSLVQLGEREGSVQRGNQQLIVEAPSPWLTPRLRERLVAVALEIGRIFRLRAVCTVEFVAAEDGTFSFTEVKPRIQRDHPATEMAVWMDLVRLQLRLAAGEPLGFSQDDVRLRGWAMEAHVNAEDPWNGFLPTPGRVERMRLPGGGIVRVETYLFPGAEIPAAYDPAIAKVVVRGEDRGECVRRLRRSLEEFTLIGPPTNVPLLLRILNDPAFVAGVYDTGFFHRSHLEGAGDERHRRDLAIAAAFAWAQRNAVFRPATSERFQSGWHRDARRLPR